MVELKKETEKPKDILKEEKPEVLKVQEVEPKKIAPVVV